MTGAPKSNFAMNKLVECVLKLRAEAKERMSEREFREAERKFDQLVKRSALGDGGMWDPDTRGRPRHTCPGRTPLIIASRFTLC